MNQLSPEIITYHPLPGSEEDDNNWMIDLSDHQPFVQKTPHQPLVPDRVVVQVIAVGEVRRYAVHGINLGPGGKDQEVRDFRQPRRVEVVMVWDERTDDSGFFAVSSIWRRSGLPSSYRRVVPTDHPRIRIKNKDLRLPASLARRTLKTVRSYGSTNAHNLAEPSSNPAFPIEKLPSKSWSTYWGPANEDHPTVDLPQRSFFLPSDAPSRGGE